MFMQKNTPNQLVTNSSIGDLKRAQDLAEKMHHLWSEISQQMVTLNSYNQDEFSMDSTRFIAALSTLQDKLRNPTLTLATAGTTSSGKSTLVNLLCGAELIPSDAQELSAGIVTIKHSPTGKRCLIVKETSAAQWECGTWDNPSNKEIHDRINKIMKKFNKAKLSPLNPPSSPQIEISYPIACFLPDNKLLSTQHLPSETAFQIIDLPGKRNLTDNLNSDVIKENCRDALSLVTYNMEETDESLCQELVEDVLQQVKLMGGSPSRMLFVLNRIDIYLKQRDGIKRQNEVVEETINEINTLITKELPEYNKAIQNLVYSKLSSLPALLAWQLKNQEESIKAGIAEQVYLDFNRLIPKAISHELTSNTNDWNEWDYQQVQEAVWKNSYAGEFFVQLDNHIKCNFSNIIIPPIFIAFEDIASDITNKYLNECKAVKNRLTVEYEEAEKSIDTDYKYIEEFIRYASDEANQLCHHLLNSSNINSATVNQKIEELATQSEFFKKLKETSILAPLYTTPEEVSKWLSGTLDGVIQSLRSGRVNFFGTKAEYLSLKHQNQLAVICNNLIGNGYTTIYAEAGINEKATTDSEKTTFESLKQSLADFSNDLSNILSAIWLERIERENHRLRESLEKAMEEFIYHINNELRQKKPDFGLNIPESILTTKNIKNSLDLIFAININLRKEIELDPWRLFLSTRDVTHIEIPSIYEIYNDWQSEIKKAESETLRFTIRMAKEYFSEIERKIQDRLRGLLSDFHSKVNSKYQEHDSIYRKDSDTWESISDMVIEMSKSLQQLQELKRK
ncbi:hypothetical protein HMY34_13715 [Thiothrix subterranea]|uniref:dynamin family protein n=1 Tax=Thiothrix subterranea TaxID=2735563 RepID=UPI00192C9921|nr:dynamin family protein [Thiothrix subterranea]QQZ29743.1 hypothetical protein HMY34_13715 [Thiothrix subterranea]